jgi:hypothetical protein
MTRAARLVYGAAALMGLGFGFVCGWRAANWTYSATNEVVYVAAVPELEEFSYRQYRYADIEHARQALLMFTNFGEQLDAVHQDNVLRRDLGFAYTRLSILADSVDDMQQSRQYLEKANYWYKAGGGHIRDLKLTVMHLDARLLNP